MAADQRFFVCVECGLLSEEIYKEFKGGSFKLCICKNSTKETDDEICATCNLADPHGCTADVVPWVGCDDCQTWFHKQCKSCHQRVDKYVEYDSVLVFLDIILHKTQAYRHVVFNKPSKVYWQLGILFLLCDSYIKWYNVKHRSPDRFGAMTDFSVLELQFYYMFLLSVLEMAVFVLSIFLGLKFYLLWTKKICVFSFNEVLRVLLLSSFGKLLAFPAVIWAQTHSAVYLGLIKLFIFTSNTVALRVLLHTTLPSLFIIATGNGLLYTFVSLYTALQLHELVL